MEQKEHELGFNLYWNLLEMVVFLFIFFLVFFFFGYFLLTQGSPTRVVMGRVFFMTGLFKSSMSL